MWLSKKTGQYSYFSQVLEQHDWGGLDVLDFGGNAGNILDDHGSTLEPARYWCIDVDQGALDAGREKHPEAHWVFYDRHSPFYNPDGVVDLPIPDLGLKFDRILAYSVFPNTSQRDLVDLVAQLRGMLKPDGRLAFTFIDPDHHSWPQQGLGSNLRWRLEAEREKTNPDLDVEGMIAAMDRALWGVLVDGQELRVGSDDPVDPESRPEHSYHSFCSWKLIRRLFPGAQLREPVNGEMQHCCMLGPA